MIDGERELRDRIMEHPWQAIGLAALLGAAFGMMASPRSKTGELFGATIGAIRDAHASRHRGPRAGRIREALARGELNCCRSYRRLPSMLQPARYDSSVVFIGLADERIGRQRRHRRDPSRWRRRPRCRRSTSARSTAWPNHVCR